MMIGRVRAHRQRQTMAIDNRQDLDTLAASGLSNLIATTLGRGKCRINEALALVDLALLAKRVRQLRQNLAQHLAFAPLLEAAVHRLVVRVALRQHVPLCASVQNPQRRVQHSPCRHWLASWATFGDILLGKIFPNTLPLLVAQSLHAYDCRQGNSHFNRF